MRELPPTIYFRRLDGTFGKVKRSDCEGWPETNLSFELRIVEGGAERWQRLDLDVFSGHRGDVEPSLYRTADSTWLRRAAWHERPTPIATVPLYYEVGEWEAHQWLTRNRYEIPPPVGKKTRQRGRKTTLGDRCLGKYMGAILGGETPPTPTEIAKEVGCHRGTASRATKGAERMRAAYAKAK